MDYRTVAVNLASLPKGEVDEFLQNIDAVMFDCDGVLWHGMEALENSQTLVIKLRQMGKKVFFVTNNNSKTREEFLVKFTNLGYETTVDEIVGTAFLAALYLKEMDFKGKVYVIGSAAITKEMEKVGITTLPIGSDAFPSTVDFFQQTLFNDVEIDSGVGAVVVGADLHFSYMKIMKAATYLGNKKCVFIATNVDESFRGRGRGEHQFVFPAGGTFVNSIKTASGREPITMGKPAPYAYEYIQRYHNLEPNRVLMIGDRGNTDILFGRNCGLHTLLVLSGETSLEDVHEWEESQDPVEKKCVPEYYLKDLNEFYNLL